jgi:membrane protein required for beta-lactamase induction
MPLEPVTIVFTGLLVVFAAVERGMLADWPTVAVIVLVCALVGAGKAVLPVEIKPTGCFVVTEVVLFWEPVEWVIV